MPVINRVVDSLEKLDTRQVDLLIADGDETLFPHNSPEPYPDVPDFIAAIDSRHVSLVSANPDQSISEQRARVIGAHNVVTPRLPTWVKYGLFRHAIRAAQEELGSIESALVIGNRWFMDIAVARRVLHRAGITSHSGVLLRRPESETAQERFDRYFTTPAEMAGATVMRKLGFDHIIRPREDSRYT